MDAIKYLFKLDKKEHARLAERVRNWKGVVRIFIHPLFEKWRGYPEAYAKRLDGRRIAEIETVLARLVAMPEEKAPPIIVFEEHWAISLFRKWLAAHLQGREHPIYVIETCESSPTPYARDWQKAKNWQCVNDYLTSLGVVKIILGGCTLNVCRGMEDWTRKGPRVSRCVGIALSYLSNDKAGPFKTELSALIEPREARSIYLGQTPETMTFNFP